jgi:hypothetical protein
MPKKVSLSTIEDQLNNATPKWVCPLTGTKFEVGDTQAIDAHKKKLLEDARKDEAKKQRAADKRRNLKLLESSTTEQGIRDALVERIRMSYPDFKDTHLPRIFIPRVKGTGYRSYLGIEKPLSNVVQGRLKVGLGVQHGSVVPLRLQRDQDVGHFYLSVSEGSALGQKIVNTMARKEPKKLDPLTKAKLVGQNPEYASKLQEMLQMAAALSEQRAKVAALNKELESMRAQVFGQSVFDFQD